MVLMKTEKLTLPVSLFEALLTGIDDNLDDSEKLFLDNFLANKSKDYDIEVIDFHGHVFTDWVFFEGLGWAESVRVLFHSF